MAKHRLWLVLKDEHSDKAIGVRCGRCGEAIAYVNGAVPIEKLNEECPREDVNQDAAQFVGEVMKGDL